MKRGIGRLEKLIGEIQAFDTKIIQKRRGPEVEAIQVSIEGTLTSVFGHKTVEYNRYIDAADLDQGGVINQEDSWVTARRGGHAYHDEAGEAQQLVDEGKERSTQILRKAVDWLLDELENTGEESASIAELNPAVGIGGHPQVQAKCGALYAAGAFAEAVEKSFKVVRDRLRDLTGHACYGVGPNAVNLTDICCPCCLSRFPAVAAAAMLF
jgi:hypothetical protein